MKNIHSSDSLAEDLIRSFQQLICSEGHIKTLIEKVSAELENGITNVDDISELNAAMDKLDSLNEELKDIADIRRRMMYSLYEIYGSKGDKTYWCQVKHLASAAYTAFEVWQASDNDPLFYDFALETNKQFIKALTHFIGVEVTTCASCFGDMLKGEVNETKTIKE